MQESKEDRYKNCDKKNEEWAKKKITKPNQTKIMKSRIFLKEHSDQNQHQNKKKLRSK